MRPGPSLKEKFQETEEKMGLEQLRGRLVEIHVRRTDKISYQKVAPRKVKNDKTSTAQLKTGKGKVFVEHKVGFNAFSYVK